MSWFRSVLDKSFSIKESMQRDVMPKHRNATLTPFHTVSMPSQKCQRFRFEHPFTSMVTGITRSGKTAWVDLHYNKFQKPFYLPPERIV